MAPAASDDDSLGKEKKNGTGILAVALEEGDKAILGEWRHVENVLTIAWDEAGLYIKADIMQGKMRLDKHGVNSWRARKPKAETHIYDVHFDGNNSIEMTKGSSTFVIHRVTSCKTVAGSWSHADKTIVIEEADGGDFTLRSEGRPPLRMHRKGVTEWEARREDTGDLSYLVEHTEGTKSLTIRRGGSAETIEFTRVDELGAAKDTKDTADDLDPLGIKAAGSAEPRSKNRRDKSKDRKGEACEKAVVNDEPAADLDDFIQSNELSKKTEEALRGISSQWQRNVMGTDGSRNGFKLLGVVRNPDAVVMSRIGRLQTSAMLTKKARGRSRSRSRRPQQRRGRKSCSRSYSDYGYSDYGYSDYGSSRSRSRGGSAVSSAPAKARRKRSGGRKKTRRDRKDKAKKKSRKEKR